MTLWCQWHCWIRVICLIETTESFTKCPSLIPRYYWHRGIRTFQTPIFSANALYLMKKTESRKYRDTIHLSPISAHISGCINSESLRVKPRPVGYIANVTVEPGVTRSLCVLRCGHSTQKCSTALYRHIFNENNTIRFVLVTFKIYALALPGQLEERLKQLRHFE
jgi:hypothetical protein